MSGLMAALPSGVQFVGPREEKPEIGKPAMLALTDATAKESYSFIWHP
jgi:hypothetical protein